MLVLSRKECQRVLLPEQGITVEILKISGSKVSLGIAAPKAIQVVRGELTPDMEKTRSLPLAQVARKRGVGID